jgi:hypothetical protein
VPAYGAVLTDRRSASTRTEAGRHSLRSHPRFGQHATLPASLPRLPSEAQKVTLPLGSEDARRREAH